eukprot:63564_1
MTKIRIRILFHKILIAAQLRKAEKLILIITKINSNQKIMHFIVSELQYALQPLTQILAKSTESTTKISQKQMRTYNRISNFGNCINTAIHKAINGGNINESQQFEIPTEITNIILSLSNHYHIQNFWLTLFDKLKRFSFIVESGSKSKEIQEFEHKCRILFKYETFEMEHDLRVSLMLCNSMKIPP